MKKLLYTLLLVCSTIMSAEQAHSPRDWAVLSAKLDQFSTGRLYWNIIRWPANTAGFNIKKKIDGKWHKLNKQTLFPHVTRNPDWSMLGLNEMEKKAANKAIYLAL
ncbi:MAG: hypothetical protein HRT88_18280, partial [Lentisphaeraceae bacterium]|nr:hypothetical protein [Lentisphaeraceae bacterium]